jgi:microcystin-dependent protein
MGQGPGLSQNYQIGEQGGVESVTLTTQQFPVHTHVMGASNANGQQPQPTNMYLAQTNPGFPYVASSQPFKQLNANSVVPAGGSQPHENMAPFVAISFIIALFGVYPSQS